MVTPKPTQDYAPELTATFTVEPASTALVLVDLQYASAWRTTGVGKKMADEGKADVVKWRFDRVEQVVLPNVKKLIDFFHKHNMEVIYLTQGAVKPDYSDAAPHMRPVYRGANNHEGTREHEILDEIKPIERDHVVNKTTISAFWSTGIVSLLRSLGIKYMLFCGVSTQMCVEGNSRDAADLGYGCVMIDDACSTTHKEQHSSSLFNFQRFYGRVTTSEKIIKELMSQL